MCCSFDLDPFKRMTFWNCMINGLTLGLFLGTMQTTVQRLCSISSLNKAKQ